MEMKSKKQNGMVMELMIVFMFVTFGLCMVATMFVASLTTERKIAKSHIDTQTNLNQIGEYFMRAVEAGGVFPTGTETNYSDNQFQWMDDNGDNVRDDNDETVRFFKALDGYKFTDQISASYGGLLSFYATRSVSRRLVVTAGSQTKMVLTVREAYIDKNTSDCEILTWYVGDNVAIEDGGEFKTTDLNILQLLWKFFGKLNGDVGDADLYSSGFLQGVIDFFGIAYDDFVDIVWEGITGGVVTW